LDRQGAVELGIVIAGARLDMNQAESAVVTLQRLNPDLASTGSINARLSYAYADALVAAGRKDEAKEWFAHADKIDEDELLDSADRLSELS
ncbi:MAG: tetratricopeptide repeat protein, partial [Corynebacterium sp.]